MRDRRSFSGPALFFLLLLAGLVVPSAGAHGGGTPQLVNESAGPYWISVWTSPEPVRAGEMHVTVAVSEPGSGQEAGPPVLGAGVRLQLRPQSANYAPLSARATNEQSANRLFYEADLTVPDAGRWDAQIMVEGPQGSGQATFTLQVLPAQGGHSILIGAAGVFAVAALLLFRFYRRPRAA